MEAVKAGAEHACEGGRGQDLRVPDALDRQAPSRQRRLLGVERPVPDPQLVDLTAEPALVVGADAEARVAESLRVELLRIKASSPQPYVSREAQAELEKMEATR